MAKQLNIFTECDSASNASWLLKTLGFRKGKGDTYYRKRRNPDVTASKKHDHDKAIQRDAIVEFSYDYKQT